MWKNYYNLEGVSKEGLLKLEVIKRKETVLHLLDKYTHKDSLTILDIGCGAGILMKEMLQRGHNVVGLDISLEMIREAKKNTAGFPSERKKFIQGDLGNISFESKTFDFIICVGVLEYQANDKIGIGEISRILKKGGFAVITVPNLLRLRNLLDPYSYVKLGPRLLRKLKRKLRPDPIDLVETFKENKSFVILLHSVNRSGLPLRFSRPAVRLLSVETMPLIRYRLWLHLTICSPGRI